MGASSGFGSLPPRASSTTSSTSVANRRRFAEVNSKAVGFYSTAAPIAEAKRTTLQRSTMDPALSEEETPRSTLFGFMNGVRMENRTTREPRHTPIATTRHSNSHDSVPVYAMLPLDTVNAEGAFKYGKSTWFHEALRLLVDSGVKGVAVDIWWGVVEKNPMNYDWQGYRDLVEMIKPTGLLLQVVLSFHACGGNVGDIVQIPLPEWVLKCGESDPDIFLCDRPRHNYGRRRNQECLSLFADDVPGILCGRSPMQCYTDFMAAFRDEFEPLLGTLITDVVVGAGPCGELRYPSYSEANGWRFPGVGEFQCYDRHALSSLAKAASDAGHVEWGYRGPHDAGEYNNWPRDTAFFCSHSGSWETSYGHFFLQWYSNSLLQHGRRLLSTANAIFASKLRQRPPMMRSESLMDGVRTWLAKTGGRLCRSPSTTSVTDLRMSESSTSLSARTNSVTTILRDPSIDSLNRDTLSCNSFQSGVPSDTLNCTLATDMGYSSVFDVETGVFTPVRPAPGSSSTESTGGEDAGQIALRKKWDAGEFLRRIICFSEQGISEVARPNRLQLSLKIAGVHWWYRTRSHAAELTAGYYNAGDRCGYTPILQLCREFDVGLTLTCVEMCDAQHPPEMSCSPQKLLCQIRRAAMAAGVRLSGENALPLFYPGHGGVDAMGLDRVVDNCHGQKMEFSLEQGRNGVFNNDSVLQLPGMHSFTFLRLGPEIMHPLCRGLWKRFMQRMQDPHSTENGQGAICDGC